MTFARRKLREVPEEAINAVDPTFLILSDNMINTLPNKFAAKQLKLLDLSGNLLEKLPDWIGELTSLESLYLDDNFLLRSLPESIGNLSQLSVLSIKGTELKKLPASLKNLKKLTDINLSYVPLGSLYPLSFDHLYYDIKKFPSMSMLPNEFIIPVTACFTFGNTNRREACETLANLYNDSIDDIVKNVKKRGTITKREEIRLCNEMKTSDDDYKFVIQSDLDDTLKNRLKDKAFRGCV